MFCVQEDRFISSELVGGECDDDSLHADTRVGWWQPKVGEETIEADARPWRDDLGKEGTRIEYVDGRPRDSAQDWKADDRTGSADRVDSPAGSDVSSTGWVTERKGESTPQGAPPLCIIRVTVAPILTNGAVCCTIGFAVFSIVASKAIFRRQRL